MLRCTAGQAETATKSLAMLAAVILLLWQSRHSVLRHIRCQWRSHIVAVHYLSLCISKGKRICAIKSREKKLRQLRSCLKLCQIFTDFKNVLLRDSAIQPFFSWLLKTSPHLKYVAILPCDCNLSLMACFADNNVSQGSVTTYARCGGIFNIHLTANLPRNLPVKIFFRSVNVWPLFWSTLSV